MPTSAEATVLTLAQQVQERVQQLKVYVQQLAAQVTAAPVDLVLAAVTLKFKFKPTLRNYLENAEND
ncbi:hypothetical protein DL768_001387 [Monosporascus sp. mg162]|nr:hypothetical protein DL768_001387 [Monosporascus sp. mg162]